MKLNKILLVIAVIMTAIVGYTQPTNDDPCGALPLNVGNSCSYTQFDNVGATGTTNPGAPSCGSYNGEDVLEISVHGNQINIKRIIDLFISKTNIRHAEPGEFSYRAFLNKKMSLTQVEGLDLLLNAKNIFSLDHSG